MHFVDNTLCLCPKTAIDHKVPLKQINLLSYKSQSERE